jgi:hypothetical protein
MIFVLYAVTAAVLLFLAHRFVLPVSRVAASLLFLLPFCFTGYALLTDGVYGPIDFAYATEPLLPLRGPIGIGSDYNGTLSDVASQMIPWRKATQWAYAHGEWPLHNPFMLSGDILAAAAQPAVYSPFMLVALLLPVAKGLTYSAAITFFTAALGAFLFARKLGCRETAALFAAAGFMYCTDVSYFILWPLGVSWTLLPLVLLGVRCVIRSPGLRSAALLATAFTLLLLAGHPETVVHIVFLGAIYGAFELALWRRDIGRAAVSAIGAGVISLMLCAIYLLPIIEALPQTEQHLYRTTVYAKAPRGSSTRDVIARIANDVFPFLQARKWKVANVAQFAPNSVTVGSVILAFAIYAIWRIRSPEVWFFAATALFGLLARADWGPVSRSLQRLPLLDLALNERFSCAGAFSLALLAAIGIEDVLRRERPLAAAATAAVVLVLITAGTLLLLRANVVGPNLEIWGDYKIFAELAGLAVATGALLLPIPSPWKAAIILGVVLVQRVMSEGGVYRTFPASVAYPPLPMFEPLKKIREPYRVIGFNMNLLPNMSAMYELEDPRGYEAMTLQTYSDLYPLWSVPQSVWFNRVVDLNRPFLSFLNVRYAVVWRRFALPDGWKPFAEQRGEMLIENTRVIERAFVPGRVVVAADQAEAFSQMMAAKDFRERAWITAPGNVYERANGPGRVTVRTRSRRYDITAEMEHDGWIVISESAWNGWRGYLDGRRVQMQRANLSFLSIHVPAGSHRVKLVYLPQSFVIGRAISLLTVAALVAFAIAQRVRRAQGR